MKCTRISFILHFYYVHINCVRQGLLTSLCDINLFLFLTNFELARTPSTRIFHISQSSIAFLSSSVNKPMLFLNWSIYVIAGLPLFLVPCFGFHISSWYTNSSFLLHICPINFNLLALSTLLFYSVRHKDHCLFSYPSMWNLGLLLTFWYRYQLTFSTFRL